MKIYNLIVIVLSSLILIGCDDDVPVPDDDVTPPTVGCTIVVGGEKIDLTSGGSDVSRVIDADENISIVSVGEDKDGGVKSVCIHYTAKITCTNGQYSQHRELKKAPICSADDKGPGDSGKTKRAITHVIHMADLVGDCQPGFWSTNVTGTVWATAENYHNGTDETATFRFEVRETIPNVTIERPVIDERLVNNESVIFKAKIYAPRPVDGSELKWFSDKDGELGQGLEIIANGLSVGNHNIEVVGYNQKELVPIRVFNDLLELYRTAPSQAEINRVMNEFTIEWVDGEQNDEKWVNYDNFDFNQESFDPSKIVAIAKLDIFRHQLFSEPLPFTNGKSLYDHIRTHVKKIYLRLDCQTNRAGENAISLNRNFSVWDSRKSGTPDNPDACKMPFQNPRLRSYPSYIVIHEGRHCEPDDPGHTSCNGESNMDRTLENGSGHAWAAMYLMWVYEYGISDPPEIKNESKGIATSLLRSRFCTTPTHSNPKVQAIIDELLGN
ncbi:MAG: hypothetical protein ACFFCW_46845 [Candidatus Hodarchaeota archaeon]